MKTVGREDIKAYKAHLVQENRKPVCRQAGVLISNTAEHKVQEVPKNACKKCLSVLDKHSNSEV